MRSLPLFLHLSPSLIMLMVSVDVKHHVYLLSYFYFTHPPPTHTHTPHTPNRPLLPPQSPFFLSQILSTPSSESLFNCVNPYRRLDAAQINFRSQPSLRQPRAIRRALSHKESPDVPWQIGAQWGDSRVSPLDQTHTTF